MRAQLLAALAAGRSFVSAEQRDPQYPLAEEPIVVESIKESLEKATAIVRSEDAKMKPAVCGEEVDDYHRHCHAECTTFTLATKIRPARAWTEDAQGRAVKSAPRAAEACARACNLEPLCDCFQVKGGMCRVGKKRGPRTKPKKGWTAYTRTGDVTQCPVAVASLDDVPRGCRGQLTGKTGNCTAYFAFTETTSGGEEVCPEGLVFSPARLRCTWPADVPGCESAVPASKALGTVGCGAHEFLLSMDDSPTAQRWLELELQDWQTQAQSPARVRAIRAREEGRAAMAILRSVAISLPAQRVRENGTVAVSQRAAVFTRAADGSLVMQAVALLSREVTPGAVTVDVMAVVSRNALFKDDAAVPGGARALLRGILDAVAKDNPGVDLYLEGTPADAVVEQMYKNHGLAPIPGEVTQSGAPRLRIVIPPHCVPFMTETALCSEVNPLRASELTYRMITGWVEAGQPLSTCAHLLPVDTVRDTVRKLLGKMYEQAGRSVVQSMTKAGRQISSALAGTAERQFRNVVSPLGTVQESFLEEDGPPGELSLAREDDEGIAIFQAR